MCRCGATALNEMVWHEKAPPTHLLFDISALKASREEPRELCPLKVYRYTGHFVSEGVPDNLVDFNKPP